MTQDSKGGKTMIGTLAPIVPRPNTSTGQHAVSSTSESAAPKSLHPKPNSSGQMPVAVPTTLGTSSPGLPATAPTGSTPVPVVGNTNPPLVTAGPTVGMRPRSESVAPVVTSGGTAILPLDLDPDSVIGHELCGYTIRRKLAEGGMGIVYEGEHTTIGRRGAIKLLKLEFCRSEDVVERFYQEARAVNAIRHENIVDVYDFGRDPQGRVFFVMEYLEGEPLSARIRRGALAWSEAFPILDQTLRALAAAHAKGFVHRDLKPDNIWLQYIDGRVQVKLLDFGIAKLVGSESPQEKLTKTGSVIGTPHYMSPEQINGSRDIDQRTDIYALGVIMYELFTGTTPFVGDTLQAIITGHLIKAPPRLADIPRTLGVPGPVAEIVDRMLVKDANARYENVNDVLSDIYDVNGNRTPTKADTLNRTHPTKLQGPDANPSNAVRLKEPAAPPPKRGKTGLIAAMVGAAALAGGGVVLWQSQKAKAPTDAAAPTGNLAVVAPPGQQTTEPKPPTPPPPPIIDFPKEREKAQLTLRASLRETEPKLRVQGADSLGVIKDQPSIESLAQATQNDADSEVRGHAAEALSAIGAAEQKALLGKLEAAAPQQLKVWYASALARLGDAGARKRLVGFSKSPDLAVALKATLTLSELSKPGDRDTLSALSRLAAKEPELREFDPYIGAELLSKAAALRSEPARKALKGLLESTDEGTQLAAAEGLAKLGDESGKKLYQDVVAKAGPNQVVAAVGQIALGEYGGLDLIMKTLADKKSDKRTMAARALGEIGDKQSLPALIAASTDADWAVRIAAAESIVRIVGIDTKVLAQASVDWTTSALKSQDWAVRKAAAGVLADIPAKEAVPLLAAAIADPNAGVRLEASRAAGKIKTPEAAAKVAEAVVAEKDPAVKEEQIKSLGEIGTIGGDAAKQTLATISNEPGRIGVLASGSLIAVGNKQEGVAKLQAAVASPVVEMRLATMLASVNAHDAIVVPLLKTGTGDRVFSVKFAAAIGLAEYADHMDEKAAAVPILEDVVANSKKPDEISRAFAALAKFGVKPAAAKLTPEQMVESNDSKTRLAAVPVVRELEVDTGVPLLRRLVADNDTDVRRAGVDAIETVAAKHPEQAKRLYKPLVNDPDPFVAAKASAQLAKLVDPTPPPPAAKPTEVKPPVDTPATPAPMPAGPSEAAVKASESMKTELPKVGAAQKAIDESSKAVAEIVKASTATHPATDEDFKKVEDIAAQALAQAKQLEDSAVAAEASLKEAIDTAGASPTPDTDKLLTGLRTDTKKLRDGANAARSKAAKVDADSKRFKAMWNADPSVLIAEAASANQAGEYAKAKQKLDQANLVLHRTNARDRRLDLEYGKSYAGTASETTEPAAQRKLLKQAQQSLQSAQRQGEASAAGVLVQVNSQLQSLGQ